MKQLYIKLLKSFLPLLFISYLAGITLFTHSHVVNGVTIVHSHPFSKDKGHSHTIAQFQLIHILNHFSVDDAIIWPILLAAITVVLCVLLTKLENNYRNFCRGILSLRAPPYQA